MKNENGDRQASTCFLVTITNIGYIDIDRHKFFSSCRHNNHADTVNKLIMVENYIASILCKERKLEPKKFKLLFIFQKLSAINQNVWC